MKSLAGALMVAAGFAVALTHANVHGQSAAETVEAHEPARYWFETYIKSAERFRDAAAKAGADALIANHTNLDGSKTKLPALAGRRAGDPNPYVIGADGVRRYLTVADECAKAGLLRLA
jgi:hypothetical protein